MISKYLENIFTYDLVPNSNTSEYEMDDSNLAQFDVYRIDANKNISYKKMSDKEKFMLDLHSNIIDNDIKNLLSKCLETADDRVKYKYSSQMFINSNDYLNHPDYFIDLYGCEPYPNFRKNKYSLNKHGQQGFFDEKILMFDFVPHGYRYLIPESIHFGIIAEKNKEYGAMCFSNYIQMVKNET